MGCLGRVWACAAAAFLCGCRGSLSTPAYVTSLSNLSKNRELARQANERGLKLAQQQDFTAAEEAFQEALRADVSLAAAHNNLGLVLLEKQRYYDAAWEFQRASKLEPRAVEPLINLGRLYEAVGWIEAAKEQYERAAKRHRGLEEWKATFAEGSVLNGQPAKR